MSSRRGGLSKECKAILLSDVLVTNPLSLVMKQEARASTVGPDRAYITLVLHSSGLIIISLGAEKAFDEIQHLFRIKVLERAGIQGTYRNIIKAI